MKRDPGFRGNKLLMADDTFGMALHMDLWNCHPVTIRSREMLARYVGELCEIIHMKPFGALILRRFGSGTKAGFSLVQLIETSAITGHFQDCRNNAYLDIFSCREFDPRLAVAHARRYFQADAVFERVAVRP